MHRPFFIVGAHCMRSLFSFSRILKRQTLQNFKLAKKPKTPGEPGAFALPNTLNTLKK